MSGKSSSAQFCWFFHKTENFAKSKRMVSEVIWQIFLTLKSDLHFETRINNWNEIKQVGKFSSADLCWCFQKVLKLSSAQCRFYSADMINVESYIGIHFFCSNQPAKCITWCMHSKVKSILKSCKNFSELIFSILPNQQDLSITLFCSVRHFFNFH